MKQKLLSILAVMLMTLTANAQTEHEYVDLGLPSGTLWATCNLGANKTYETGNIYAWGDTEPTYVNDYALNWENYKWCMGSANTLTKYCTKSDYGYNGFTDGLKELLPEDDAATQAWGEEWQTPGWYEFKELFHRNYTEVTKAWEYIPNTMDRVEGIRVTSKINGNFIFIPTPGLKDDKGFQILASGRCYLWERDFGWANNPSLAYCCEINETNIDAQVGSNRYHTYGIRPVRVKKLNVYTEFVEETGTLTYYYDFLRSERTGITEKYVPVSHPDAVRFRSYYNKVKKVVIDPSMKDAPMTSFNGMFFGGTDPKTWVMYKLSKLTTIEGLENLNTENVTDMSNMFSMCSSLTSLDLSSFNTSRVTKTVAMFQSCEKLETVDVSSFDISKVTDMGQMFNYCPKLTTIYCNDDWSTSTAASDYMFSGCTLLVGGKGTVFDSNFIDKTYARPDGGEEAPGYFTERKYVVSDVNCDGTADTQDVLMIYEYMKTVGSEANGAREDVNGDGSVDTQDILMIYEYIRSH